MPTLKTQEFNDAFEGLIFLLIKIDNEIQNVFLQDKGNHFKNLSSNISKNSITNIIAQKGIAEKRKLFFKWSTISTSQANKKTK